MKKIVIYARVSTRKQEKEETIKTQLNELHKIYKKPIKEYIDNPGNSASLERKALRELREDARKGVFNVLAVYALDRLSREPAHQWLLMEEFKKYNIQLMVLGRPVENTPEGEFSTMVISAAAKLEKEKIIQRMLDGRRRKIYSEGRFLGRYPRYGWDLIRKTDKRDGYWIINKEEAQNVRKIFKIFLEEQSIRATYKRAYALGIRGRGRFYGKPTIINPQYIKTILSCEAYIGNSYYGKTVKDSATEKWVETPKSEWKLLKVPAIIDKVVFKRAQDILVDRTKTYTRKTKYLFLCQGLIKCLDCGSRYYARQTFNGYKLYHYYQCLQKSKRHLDRPRCNSSIINTETLDKYVWDYISDLIKNTDKVKKAVGAVEERRREEVGDYQKVYDVLKLEISKIKKKKEKLFGLYGDDVRNISKEDLDEQFKHLNGQEQEINNQISQTEAEFERIEKMNSVEEEIEKLCLQYQKKIDNLSGEEKKLVIRRWVKEINLTDSKEILIRVRIPQLERSIKRTILMSSPELATASTSYWYNYFTNK